MDCISVNIGGSIRIECPLCHDVATYKWSEEVDKGNIMESFGGHYKQCLDEKRKMRYQKEAMVSI